MTAATFPTLTITARALGLSTDQITAVLDAATADGEAIERIGQAELDAAWNEGWEACDENAGAFYGEKVDEVNQLIREENKRIKRHNAWIDRIAADQERLDERTKRLERWETELANERADLDLRRAELEDPHVRRCDQCTRPLSAHKRADSRYCSPRCRVAAHRARSI